MRFDLVRPGWRGWLDAALDLTYPERCGACDAPAQGPGLCAACALSLYALGPACPLCAEPAEGPEPCSECQGRPPPQQATHAPWRYGGELGILMRRLKYGDDQGLGRPELLRSAAALLAPAFVDLVARTSPDCVVAVPTGTARLVRRGFCLPDRLLGLVRTYVPCPPPRRRSLVRCRDTAEQAGLSRQERLTNMTHAFAVSRGSALVGKRVLLVDDVMTTGATIASAATTLLEAGAESVTALVLARVTHDS